MSLTSGPINEVEQAAEKATDHAFSHAPDLVKAVFAALKGLRIKATFTVEFEDKQ